MRTLISTLLSVTLWVMAMPTAQAEFASAIARPAPGKCAAGSFFDPRQGGECWSCPAGTVRNLNAVQGGRACTKPPHENVATAQFVTSMGCPAGSFRDPRNGGECWSCPSDRPRRTANPVQNDKACATTEIWGEKLSAATYRGKPVGSCPAGSFFDPRSGGECWSCPTGTVRTAAPVTAANACTAWVGETVLPASFVNKTGCRAGEFWDPVDGGSCWACPANQKIRTIASVKSNRACTNEPAAIFAVDSQEFCRAIVTAMSQGSEGSAQISNLIGSLLEPVKEPIDRAIADVTARIASNAEVDKVITAASQGFDAAGLDKMAALARSVETNKRGLQTVLLDPNLICGNSVGGTAIEQRLTALGVKVSSASPQRSWDQFFISNAYASSTREPFHFYSIMGALTLPQFPAGVVGGYGIATNYKGKGGIYVVLGPQISTRRGMGFSLGTSVFPAAVLEDFEGPVPAGNISLSAQPLISKLFAKASTAGKVGGAALPQTVELNFDLAFRSSPSIGISTDLSVSTGSPLTSGSVFRRIEAAPVQVSGNVTWSLPIVTWGK